MEVVVSNSGSSSGSSSPSAEEGKSKSSVSASAASAKSKASTAVTTSTTTSTTRQVSTYDLTGNSPTATVTTTSIPYTPSSSSNNLMHTASAMQRAKARRASQSQQLKLRKQQQQQQHCGGHDASFPVKLHQLLSTSDPRVIQWQPDNDGRSFCILNCDAFERDVLPRLYRNANVEMFGQLLSLYGFQRVDHGPYEGDYYHAMFMRDKPQLAHMIRKMQDSPNPSPTSGPTAYPSMSMGGFSNQAFSSSMHATVTSRLVGLSFPSRLHYLLCHGVYDLGLERIMSWQPGGHSFAVHSSEDFEIQGLAEMLGTPGHASFRAQLFLHAFQRVQSAAGDVEAYYHPDFVREQPQLCRLIKSRNHIKSSFIRGGGGGPRPTSAPCTPKVTRHRSIVSPMSDTSTKSMIDKLPDGLFLDSQQSSSGQEQQQQGRLLVELPPSSSSPTTAAAEETHDADSSDGAAANNKSANRKRARVGQMMAQNYFPFKLHSLLTLSEKFGYQNILCWAPHGRCFLVNDKDLFCAAVLPLFRHSEFASFRAQLKAYGFVRIGKSGPDKGAYYHTAFLRGRPELCANITRRPKNVHGTVRGRPKGRHDNNVEPDFYRMQFLPDLNIASVNPPPPGSIKDVLETALTQIIPPPVVTREVSSSGCQSPSSPTTSSRQICNLLEESSSSIGSHHSSSGTGGVAAAPRHAKYLKQHGREQPFPVRLHAFLSDSHEEHGFGRLVTWHESGRAFGIVDEKQFEQMGCVRWLGLTSLAHFKAELDAFGFKRKPTGAYFHEMFHKALPHLCRCIKREVISSSNKLAASGCSDVSSVGSHSATGAVKDTKEDTATRLGGSSISISSSNSSDQDHRTCSPEMEVAIALTAMDDRSNASGEMEMPSVSSIAIPTEPMSPLKTDDHSSQSPGTSSIGALKRRLSSAPALPLLALAASNKRQKKQGKSEDTSIVPKRRQMSDPPGRYEMEQQEERRKAKEMEEKANKLATTAEEPNAPSQDEGTRKAEKPTGASSSNDETPQEQQAIADKEENILEVTGSDSDKDAVQAAEKGEEGIIDKTKRPCPAFMADTTTDAVAVEPKPPSDHPKESVAKVGAIGVEAKGVSDAPNHVSV
ncbi:Heat stress transcription factor [Seminavis robusta]|uniref:Heat stress transcription factor n=1 Tax=Seminavis robusta TaxID=568900 RepID=A0A9N8D9X6_9STRA|nr:Heat stress transcription factor [Seminavis robusta]|eukprot:Sro28_g018890.1 Heat stress transcription factor (1105) ;mRNA; r:154302-157834